MKMDGLPNFFLILLNKNTNKKMFFTNIAYYSCVCLEKSPTS